MWRAVAAAFGLLFVASTAAAQERIQLGGTSGMIPIMQELAKAYEAGHPSERIEVLTGSLDSTGGIKAVAAGRIAIGLTGRPLRGEEKAKLVQRVIGRMPMVVAVHRDVAVSSLRESQFCDIYAGRITSWTQVGGTDGKILVLTRSDLDSSTKNSFRDGIACFKTLKESPDAVVLNESTDMNSALANRASTIGLTDFVAVVKGQGRFKAMAIDGVAPSAESVRSGRYKLVREFGVVTLGEPQGLAKRFLDFVASPEGERILAQDGIIGLR